jgi:hypothetical protein
MLDYAQAYAAVGTPLTSHYFSRPSFASSAYYAAAAPLAVVRPLPLHFLAPTFRSDKKNEDEAASVSELLLMVLSCVYAVCQVVVVVLMYPLVSLVLLVSLALCLVLYKRAKDKEEEEYLRKQEQAKKQEKDIAREAKEQNKAAQIGVEKKLAALKDASDAESTAAKKAKGRSRVSSARHLRHVAVMMRSDSSSWPGSSPFTEDLGDKPVDGPASPRLLRQLGEKDDNSPQSRT